MSDQPPELPGPPSIVICAYLRRMFKLAQQQGKISDVPYFPMQGESEPWEGFVERPDFERLLREGVSVKTLQRIVVPFKGFGEVARWPAADS